MVMGLGSYASRVVATKVVATDGTGDFTDIQSAIDDLPAGGGVVYVKEGTYTITSSITIGASNTSIFGAGNATLIQTASDIPLITATTKHNCILKDFYLKGDNGTAAQHGISLTSCENTQLHGLKIEDMGGNGIALGGSSTRSRITNNEIVDCDGNGMALLGDDTIVINNVIKECDYAGIVCVSVDNIIIKGNVVYSNGREGIYFTGAYRSTISGNVAHDNGQAAAATYSGITLASTTVDTTITGNVCNDNTDYGINIEDVNSARNIIIGNILRNNTTGGYSDSGTDTEIAHNQVS